MCDMLDSVGHHLLSESIDIRDDEIMNWSQLELKGCDPIKMIIIEINDNNEKLTKCLIKYYQCYTV